MRYSVVHLRMGFAESWQEDVFVQGLFDLGFDTMDGQDAYIQTETWEQQRVAIQSYIAGTENVALLSVEDCVDMNWNAVWESEHVVEELPMGVRIVPHCAFGAGHHETTGMMIDALLQDDLHGKLVLDNGCGTGVLAIYAALRGAEKVIAVDIDENSVANTQENAVCNGVADKIEVCLGSTPPEGNYDLIMANIHRNILIEQMSAYARYLQTKGEVRLSGFYVEDIALVRREGEEKGLTYVREESRNGWAMLVLKKDQ